MPLVHDIPDDQWICLNRSCPVTCDVLGDSAQFQFGTPHGTSHLIADEGGLAKLATMTTTAPTRLRAIPEGAVVEFVVTDPDLTPAD